jgi:hypothetical protein
MEPRELKYLCKYFNNEEGVTLTERLTRQFRALQRRHGCRWRKVFGGREKRFVSGWLRGGESFSGNEDKFIQIFMTTT